MAEAPAPLFQGTQLLLSSLAHMPAQRSLSAPAIGPRKAVRRHEEQRERSPWWPLLL